MHLSDFNIKEFLFPPSATADHSDRHLETRKDNQQVVNYLKFSECRWSQGSCLLRSFHLPMLRPSPATLTNSKSAVEEAIPLNQGTVHYQY